MVKEICNTCDMVLKSGEVKRHFKATGHPIFQCLVEENGKLFRMFCGHRQGQAI